MKIRFAGGGLCALALAAALGSAACGGGKDDNANNTNTAANANARATATATPSATPTPTASEDTAVKNKTEAALTKAGISGVTVTVDGGVVTLKGEVPKAKLQDAVKAANEAGAKRVMNQLTTK